MKLNQLSGHSNPFTNSSEKIENSEEIKKKLHRLNIPGFITDEEIGLGDVLKRVTYAIGIKPCDGCKRRAAALNRWLVFSPRQKK